MKWATDAVTAHNSERGSLAALFIVALLALRQQVAVISARIRITLTEKVKFDMEERLMSMLSTLPTLHHFESPSMLDDIDLLRQRQAMLGGALNMAVVGLSAIIRFGLTLALLMRVDLAFGVLPFLVLPTTLYGRRQQEMWRQFEIRNQGTSRRSSALYAVACTPAAGREARVFGHSRLLVSLFSEFWQEVYLRSRRLQRQSALKGWLLSMPMFLGNVLAIAWTARRASQGQATTGDVVLVVALTGQLSASIGHIVGHGSTLLEQMRTVDRFIWLQDYVRSFERSGGEVSPPAVMQHGLDLKSLTFSYPGSDRTALVDLTVRLPTGSVVALVGENGSGKSTLVKLLAKLYEPDAGAISVDGVDLWEIKTEAWRSSISAAFQDFCRLELLLHESVGVGELPRIAQIEEVRRALRQAASADLEIAVGMHAQLGTQWPGGRDLSTGQWQRTAMSRAHMRDRPLLLILDEPTSALDAVTEFEVFERYAAVGRDLAQITILVSHRFSSVMNADLIIVLEDGRLAQLGNHQELMGVAGLYRDMFEAQAAGYR